MSDKEKVEKENEQFSSSILYVATAVYVGVCAMVFGALYAKLPTFGEAFLVLMKDYGTILAGIPVLVAVVVAKQQLDAGRKQHVATIKYNLRKDLDALDDALSFLDRVQNFSIPRAKIASALTGHRGIVVPIVPDEQLNIWKQFVSFDAFYELQLTSRFASTLKSVLNGENFAPETVERIIEGMQEAARISRDALNVQKRRLSEYWS